MPTEADRRLDAALAIGNALCGDALWWDGRCTFTTDDIDAVDGDWQTVHRSCEGDLYCGNAGIALFLARLAARTGDRVVARTALGTMAQALVDARSPELQRRSALFTGRLGIAVAAAMAGAWLDSDALRDQAAALAEAVAADGTAGFSGGDLMAGLSGGVAGALILARRLGDPRLTDWAVALGDTLIASARRESGGWHWPTAKEPIGLCGLSHGAAGIAWALAELAVATGEARYAAAAASAVAHERRWFDAAIGNWPDLSPESRDGDGRPSFSHAWCHGAPGIALSRLRLWELTGCDTLRDEVRVAVATTAARLRTSLAAGTGNYSLCHGLAGNAEALIQAGVALPTERRLAEAVATAGIERFGADPRGWPAGVDSGSATSPTLMLGLAGTGYFLLRVDDADATPSILLPDTGVTGEPRCDPVLARAFATLPAVEASVV